MLIQKVHLGEASLDVKKSHSLKQGRLGEATAS